MKTRKDFI